MSASPNSAGGVKQARETFDELCNHVEHALGVEIPQYLKNILLYSGFDNRVTLRSLEDSDMSHLESFGRSDSYYKLVAVELKQGETMKSFYGNVYQLDWKHFAIPVGHRKLLKHMVACLQKPQEPQKPPKTIQPARRISRDARFA